MGDCSVSKRSNTTKWVTRSRNRMYRGHSVEVWRNTFYVVAYVDGLALNGTFRTIRTAQRAAELEVDRRLGSAGRGGMGRMGRKSTASLQRERVW